MCRGKRIEDLDSPSIDVLDMRAIQIHGFVLSKVGAAFPIQQSRPLLRDLAFQLEQDISPAFLYRRDLQHRCLSFYLNVMPAYSAMAMPQQKSSKLDGARYRFN
jgi:hypothetical protein